MTRLSKRERLAAQAQVREEKRKAARDELIQGALQTLSDLGYAHTSLRDIAEQAGRSVGLVHYYFDDKVDLIIACVSWYKARFVETMRGWVSDEAPSAALQDRFVEGLVQTIRDDSATHRLWYDIRAEAMFEARFREPVVTIEANLLEAFCFVLRRLDLPEEHASLAYVSMDGAFRYALSGFLHERAGALQELAWQAHAILNGIKVMAVSQRKRKRPNRAGRRR